MTASNPIPPARAWAEIDLGALVANARSVSSVSGSRLLPMVKANAYGTGAAAVTRALEALDPWGYGVVDVVEGTELRRAGIGRPIIVFGHLTPDTADVCLRDDLRPVLGDLDAIRLWLARGERPFHVEIDTGMSRLGLSWRDHQRLAEAGRLLSAAPGFEGIFTHFHSADVDLNTVRVQWDRLTTVVGALPRRPSMVHAANSAASMLGREFAGDLVRPGIYLYGGAAGSAPGGTVVRFRAPVVATRRLTAGDSVSYGAAWRADKATTVVTLAAGYADGVPRALGGSGTVEVQGAVFPIAGRITMDFTMVDVGNADVPLGTAATIYGGMLSIDAQAAAARTISYELLTGLGPKVDRRYSGGA